MSNELFIKSPTRELYDQEKENIDKDILVFIEDKEQMVAQEKEYQFVPSNGNPGQVLTQGEGGPEWKDVEVPEGSGGSNIDTVEVNVDNNTGTPSATGQISGNTLTLNFNNLKGEKGDQGPQGPQGPKGDPGEGGNVQEATSSEAGIVKLGDDTVQTVAAATPSATASRTYPIQKNSDGQMVVNVPWSNTTYSTLTDANIKAGTANTAGTITCKLLRDNFQITNVYTASTSGAVSLDASTYSLAVITCTGNISSVALSALPRKGQELHVIFYATAARTVTISHSTGSGTSSRICPEAKDLTLNVPAGGYAEVSFLYDGTRVYVRGV